MQPFPDDLDSVVLSDTETARLDLLLIYGVEQYLVELGREALQEPIAADIPEMPASMARRMQEYLVRQKHRDRTKHRIKAWPSYVRRVITIILLALFATSLFFYSTVDAFRIDVNNLFIHFSEQFIVIHSKSSHSMPSGESSTSLYPEYVPDGFQFFSTQNSDNYTVIKFTNQEKYFMLERMPSSGTNFHMPAEKSSTKTTINGLDGQLSILDDECFLVWYNDAVLFSVSGNIDSETAVKIAESVYLQ